MLQPYIPNRGQVYRGAGYTTAGALAYQYLPYVLNELWKTTGQLGGMLYKRGREYYRDKYRAVYPRKKIMRNLPKKKGKKRISQSSAKVMKIMKTFQGNLEFRNIDSRYIRTAGYNQTNHSLCDDVNMAAYESVLGNLKFFNPSAPGTLISASGATGTYYREYLFRSVSSIHTVKNNYQIPCKVTLYYCTVKNDTNIGPITAFTDGISDGSNAASTSLFINLTDSDEFNDLWRIAKKKTKLLLPGRQMSLSYRFNNMLYSPATYDSHTSTYQKRFKCFVVICRVEGVQAHDSAANEVGFTNAGVDVTWRTSYKVQYDAGGDINYLYVSENQDSFTNGPLVSSMPVADNINYSVT